MNYFQISNCFCYIQSCVVGLQFGLLDILVVVVGVGGMDGRMDEITVYFLTYICLNENSKSGIERDSIWMMMIIRKGAVQYRR